MYEAFFEMTNTPFVKNIPVSSLYIPPFIEEAQGRLTYGVDNNLFIVVTGDPGCLADSKLTPRWFYSGLLNQLGLQPRFYRGDAKRQLQRELEIIRGVQHKKVICVLDEAHLLDKETLEEFRFMLNYRFDSESPMGLILVGQTELWDQKLRYQNYAAIRQRIDMNIVLRHLDRAETGMYIDAHLVYAGGKKDIFTDRAIDEVFKSTNGIPRMINRVCEKTLMYASQQQKRLIDEHMVQYVTEHEMLKGGGI